MKLHLDTFGDGGRTLVLVHGASGDGGTWADIVPRYVERGYRVLVPDLRGHGRSAHADSYAMETFAEDLVETLPGGLDVVAGHSLGGRVLAFAVSRLDLGRAVYLDPAFRVVTRIPNGTFPQWTEEDDRPMTAEEMRSFHPEWSHDEILQSMASFGRWDSRMMRDPGLIDRDALPPVPPPVPSLVVLADPTDLVDDATRAELTAAGYEFRVQPGAGHVLHADDPDMFVKTLDGWI